ncbi:putative RNA recognition motif domain, nucleotide-binding alpha-beta plait domain superfamily [Helianthus debilis subsp. tardiflorus]
MKPVFCGNFEYETRQSDLERLFGRYGRVERVDMKSGVRFEKCVSLLQPTQGTFFLQRSAPKVHFFSQEMTLKRTPHEFLTFLCSRLLYSMIFRNNG